MVAINSRLRYLVLVVASLTSLALLSFSSLFASSTVVARIAALEGDSTYMSLLTREATLADQEDSLSHLLTTYRDEFAAGGAQAAQARNAIVDIEMELFDVRGKHNTISGEIANIEQLWALDNAAAASSEGWVPDSATATATTNNDTSKTIARSALAKERLPKADWENLIRAEAIEAKCAAAYKEYMGLYDNMREQLQLYNQTDDEQEATTHSGKFHTMKHSADSLSTILQSGWGEAYDNKDFAYNMLMEIMGYNDLLDQSGEMTRECESQIAAADIDSESSAVVRYNFQKRKMVKLEGIFASRLQLSNAVDSLRGAEQKLSSLTPLDELPALTFVKRNFILYEPILFSTTPVYDAQNPIPGTVMYKKGTIYRIHYGSFNAKQSPSIFRGAYPLSYTREGGLWVYYGGGYETFAEADEAAALCKRQGFRRPEVVIWRDSVKRNLYRDPFPADQKYRVQIIGLAELPESVKSVINAHCPEAELSKVGADRFVVGPLVGHLVVEEFTQALESVNGVLTTNITEIE